MVEVLVIAVLAILLAVAVYLYCRMKVEVKSSRRSDIIKKAFMNNVCNEMLSPLKVVNKMADLISTDNLYLSKSEKRNIADQLRYNANLIQTLFDEVMVFTDTDAVGHQLKDEMFSPNALCRRCLEGNMHSLYHRSAVRLNFKRNLSDEFFVKSDRHVVELIINKLVMNACRFTEEGEVMVGCNVEEHPGMLTIFVSDTGVGIPETRLNSLFSWFENPDDLKDDAELDLSICQKLAEKLGGEVLVDTESRRVGTRVLLLLPLK